jgi:hypothetical protein
MKLPFEFGTKFIFRLVLPGLTLALLTLQPMAAIIAVLGWQVTQEVLVGVLAVVYGWLIVIADMHIYIWFEGRRYWPGLLRRCFCWDEFARLVALRKSVRRNRPRNWRKNTKSPADERAYREASVELRRFPIDEATGKYTAPYPTRLGNLITAYEEYPNRIYGLDVAFYWPRLWIVLPADVREELDAMQALADSTVYMSFVLYVGGAVNLIGWLISPVFAVTEYRDPMLGIIGGSCVGVGYILYHVSLHLHAQYGEFFKATFDVHACKIDLSAAAAILDNLLRANKKKERNKILWRYLHNYRIKDDASGRILTPAQWWRRKRAE